MTEYIGLIGISFSAILASIAYFYKTKQDKLKVLRGTLYLLLELRFRVLQSMLNPVDASEHYFKKIDSILDKLAVQYASENSDELNKIKKLVSNHFENIISVSTLKVDAKLIREIDEALNSLSKFEPRLAYKLQGQHTIDNMINQTYSYSSSIKKSFSEIVGAAPLIEKAMNRTERLAASHLERHILMLAFKISLVDWIKTKYLLKRTLTVDNRYNYDEIENQLLEIFQSITDKKSKLDKVKLQRET